MPCIILKSPAGERKVEQNTPYRLMEDEQIVGVDWFCGRQLTASANWEGVTLRMCSNCGQKGVYEST